MLCVLQKLSVGDFWQLLSFHKGQYEAGTVKITSLDIISNSAWFSDSLISVIAGALAAVSSIFSSKRERLKFILHLPWCCIYLDLKWPLSSTSSRPFLETCKHISCQETAASWNQQNLQDINAQIVQNKTTKELNFFISLQTTCLLIQLHGDDRLNGFETHFFLWHSHQIFSGATCCLQHRADLPHQLGAIQEKITF